MTIKELVSELDNVLIRAQADMSMGDIYTTFAHFTKLLEHHLYSQLLKDNNSP